MLNPFLAPRTCTMLKVLTKKLRNQTLNEIQPFQLKVKVDGVVSCRVLLGHPGNKDRG